MTVRNKTSSGRKDASQIRIGLLSTQSVQNRSVYRYIIIWGGRAQKKENSFQLTIPLSHNSLSMTTRGPTYGSSLACCWREIPHVLSRHNQSQRRARQRVYPSNPTGRAIVRGMKRARYTMRETLTTPWAARSLASRKEIKTSALCFESTHLHAQVGSEITADGLVVAKTHLGERREMMRKEWKKEERKKKKKKIQQAHITIP